MATTVLNTTISEAENKILDTSSLVTAGVLNTKISEIGDKISDYAKYITNQEFNKLTVEIFNERLRQANLVNKADFFNKLTNFNKRITLNKTKHLEVQKKLKSLITKYNFFSGRTYFRSNNGSQNTFFINLHLIL